MLISVMAPIRCPTTEPLRAIRSVQPSGTATRSAGQKTFRELCVPHLVDMKLHVNHDKVVMPLLFPGCFHRAEFFPTAIRCWTTNKT